MYTDSQLKSANKENLLSMAIDLRSRIEAMASQPLTSGAVERRLLDLSEKAIDVKSKDEKRKEDYEIAIKEIEAKRELDLKELELRYNASLGEDVERLNQEYEALEKAVEKAKENLDLGLKKKEIELKEELDVIEANFNEQISLAEEKATKAINDSNEKLNKLLEHNAIRVDDSNAQVVKVKIENERTLEQIKYDHSIAIRDKKLETAEKISGEYSKVIVNKDEYEALKAFEKESEEDIIKRIEAADNAAKSAMHAKYGSEIKDIKAKAELELSLKTKDADYLQKALSSAEDLIKDLRVELSKVPDQIKEAVAAAKSEVTVNQDNKK